MVSKILKDAGFQLNRSKARYGRKEISLSGFVVSEDIHLSRKKLCNLNKLLHFFGKTESYTGQKYRVRKQLFQSENWLEQVNDLELRGSHGEVKRFEDMGELLDYLCGWRSLIISLIQTNERQARCQGQLQSKVKKLELVIDQILTQQDMI